MKKFITFMLFILFGITLVNGADIAVNNKLSIYNSCNPSQSVDVYYYLPNGTDFLTRTPYDVFRNTIDSLISKNSIVDLWRNGNVLTNCTNWKRVSNATVANDPDGVVAVQNYDGCTFNKPSYLKYSNPNQIDAQIHFNIKYHKIFPGAPSSLTSRLYYRDHDQSDWSCYPAGNTVSNYSSCPEVTVKYGNVNSHVGECLNYRIFWCGDGILNRPEGSTSYTNGTHVEQCDPNDPNQVGWGTAGCSNTCEAITETPPTCSGSITPRVATSRSTSPLQNYDYRVSWTISGTFNPTQINIQPSSFSPNYKNVNGNVGSFGTIAPNGYYGPFTATMTVTNSAGSNTCRATYNIPQPERKVCGDGKLDQPNDDGVYEQCDNGPNFGNGCNNQCQLMTPSCDLDVSPVVGILGYPTEITMTKESWAITDYLNLGNILAGGVPNIMNPSGSYMEYIYPQLGEYIVTYSIRNNYEGTVSTGTTRPTSICTGKVQIISGCTITTAPSTIELGEVAKVSWQIWPDFNVPAFMQVSHPILNPAFVGPWPHNVYYKTGEVFVGPNITGTGVYTFSINSHTIYGQEFACTGKLNVLPAPLMGKLDIKKTLLGNNTGFVPGDYVGFKIELKNIGSGVFNDAFIRDVLPTSLDLVSHEIHGIDLYLVGQWMSGANWIFEYSGFDMAPGKVVTVYMTGKVKENASPHDTINWAFTSGDYDNEYFKLRPVPYIQKYQSVGNIPFTSGDINVSEGDLIKYRVDFANVGAADAIGVRVVDHMPSCVSYLFASIHGVEGASSAQTTDNNGRHIIEYAGFDLKPGQTGYMIIEGKISNSSVCSTYDSFINNSYIYFYNPTTLLKSSVIAHKSQKSIVTLTKDSDPDEHPLGDDKLFEITVKNQGPNKISDVVLQDIWPNSACISYVDWTGTVGLTKSPTDLVWKYPNLNPGEALVLYISGHISDNLSCINPKYTNRVRLTYIEGGNTYKDQADYNFAVLGAEEAMCNYVTNGGVVITDNNNQGSKTFTCYSQNGVVADEIVLNCGNGVTKVGYNTSSLTNTCNYVYNEALGAAGNTYNVQCYVDDHTRDECKTSVWLDPGYVGICGNGIIEAGEECDLWTNVNLITKGVRIGDYLDINRDYLAGIYGNGEYYCKECRIRKYKTDDFAYQPPSCLGVNMTMSLMDNELMPFWWRLWKRTNQFVRSNYNCSAIDSNEKITYIDEDSMKCTFAVYDGNKYQQINDRPLYTFVKDCYEKDNSIIFNYFERADTYRIDFTKVAGKYVLNARDMFKDKKVVDTYGEYKLVLENVEYNYCDPNSKTWKSGRTYKGICEVDFALTRPYIMQVSTFGVSPIATDASDFLTDFYDMRGEKLIKSTDIEDTMLVKSSSYGFDSEVINQMENFKNKYESLAVAVDGNFKIRNNLTVSDIFKGAKVKKVPNQMIFFVKGEGELVLEQMTNRFPSDPFTIYVEGMDVLVRGSITTNGMIITTNSISFEDYGYCEEGGQVVNGIFIAKGGFNAKDQTRNIDKNKDRCPWGNLHVRGVLIGDGIDKLVNNRRSHLNDWFTVKNNSELAIRRERKNEIFEGAALLIEYNPSLWTQLPPGADSFTEILDVYRK